LAFSTAADRLIATGAAGQDGVERVTRSGGWWRAQRPSPGAYGGRVGADGPQRDCGTTALGSCRAGQARLSAGAHGCSCWTTRDCDPDKHDLPGEYIGDAISPDGRWLISCIPSRSNSSSTRCASTNRAPLQLSRSRDRPAQPDEATGKPVTRPIEPRMGVGTKLYERAPRARYPRRSIRETSRCACIDRPSLQGASNVFDMKALARRRLPARCDDGRHALRCENDHLQRCACRAGDSDGGNGPPPRVDEGGGGSMGARGVPAVAVALVALAVAVVSRRRRKMRSMPV